MPPIDNLTWATLHVSLETEQTPDDWAETLKLAIPAWEETATSEVIDREDKHPLTKEETKAFLEIEESAVQTHVKACDQWNASFHRPAFPGEQKRPLDFHGSF